MGPKLRYEDSRWKTYTEAPRPPHTYACMLYMNVGVWVAVPVHVHACQMSRAGVFKALLLSASFIWGRVSHWTWQPASLRSSCFCPLPPHSAGVTRHRPCLTLCMWMLESTLRTSGLVSKHAYPQDIFPGPWNNILWCLRCLLAQRGSSWIQFLRCIICRDTKALLCKCWHGIKKIIYHCYCVS